MVEQDFIDHRLILDTGDDLKGMTVMSMNNQLTQKIANDSFGSVPDIEGACPIFLEEGGKKRPHARMTKIVGKCLGIEIEINPDRKVVLCDGLTFPWEWKEEDGYFLVKHMSDNPDGGISRYV